MTIDLSGAAPLALDARASGGIDSPLFDVSPDGTTVVFVGDSDGVSRLYVRRLDSFEIRELEGTEGVIHPFFSPDGESIGFLTNYQLKVVSLSGGAPRVLSAASRPIIGTWPVSDWIYFGDNESRSLVRVSIDGAVREEVLSGIDTYGRALPDGQHVFATRFTGSQSADYAEIHLVSITDGKSRALIQNGYDAQYVPPGYVLFGRGGDLFAVGFDLDALEVQTEPVRVASNVRMDGLFANVQAAASDNGVLVYAPGGDSARGRLAWVDRDGGTEFLLTPERAYGQLDLSSDGRRLAVDILDVRDHILIYEPGLGETLLQGPVHQYAAVWSKGGDKIAYTRKEPNGQYQILVQVPYSGRAPEVVAEGDDLNWVTAVLWMVNDSRVVVQTWPQIRRFSAGGDGPLPAGLEVSTEYESFIDLHPDGRWVAVHTGDHVEVRSLDGALRYQVSAGFGTEPRWCAACDELFYREGNRVFSVRVRATSDFEWDPPQLAFDIQDFIDTGGQSFDVTPDGQRAIVVMRERVLPRDRIQVVTDWTSVLESPASD